MVASPFFCPHIIKPQQMITTSNKTKSQQFQDWLEYYIFDQQRKKGYKVITIEWKEYLSKFTKATGITIGKSTAREAKKALIVNDVLRQNLKTVKNALGEPRGTYMQICLGCASKLYKWLKSAAKKAYQTVQRAFRTLKKSTHRLAQIINAPELRSHEEVIKWICGYTVEPVEVDDCTDWNWVLGDPIKVYNRIQGERFESFLDLHFVA